MEDQFQGSAQTEKVEGLTYDEAMDRLDRSIPVKLPEWLGFWFKLHGVIYVYTKEGEILNTPWLEKFKDNTDWKVASYEDVVPAFTGYVKALRLRIDSVLTLFNKITKFGEKEYLFEGTRETSLAITSIQLAFMYLGKHLGALGAANPYPQSFNPKSPDIEKHADKASSPINPFTEELISPENPTAATKALRAEIAIFVSLCEFVARYRLPKEPLTGPPALQAAGNLAEANLWLGQQLNNIREAGNNV